MVQFRENVLTGASWAGAFAGLLLGLFSYLVLLMIGVGVGGATFSPQAAGEYAWGALIWLAVSAGIAAFIAGYVGSRVAPGITTRRAGLYTGLLTGTLLVLSLTLFALNSATSIIGAGLSSIRAITGGVTQMAGENPAQTLGIQDEIQQLTGGLERSDVENLIRQASPNLDQQQARAATDAALPILNQSRDRIVAGLRNPTQLGETVNREFDSVRTQMSGPQFTQRLQDQGLSPQQAQEVTSSLTTRVQQMRDQANQMVSTVQQRAVEFSEEAAGVASRAAWTWLAIALVIVGLSTFGGSRGTNEADLDEYEEIEHQRIRREEEVRVHHH